MKNFFLPLFIFIFLSSCSFDNKTGIWTGEEKKIAKEKINSDLKPVFKKDEDKLSEKEYFTNKQILFGEKIKIINWTQQYQNNANHIGRGYFSNLGNYEKFSKISRHQVNKNILYKDQKLFFSDKKGNIGVFSIADNKELFKYNFYKKKFKNMEKKINLIIKDNFLIAADNFGYLYCIDFIEKKIVWAKNYRIPFRSNLKILGNNLFIVDEQNKIIKINLITGDKLDEIYTQPSKTVSSYNSNLSIDNDNNIVVLTTNGTLYSLNLLNKKIINWILNFKSDDEITFQAKPIIITNNDILITTNNKISVISTNGKKKWEKELSINVNPVISGKYILLITENNYLMLIDKNTGDIIHSKNIFKMMQIESNKKYSKKIKKFDHIYVIKNKILAISSSYFIELTLGKKINVSSIRKNPFDILSDIIFYENNLLLVSDNNRIFKVN